MSKMIANQRLKSMATDLHLTLVKARGEAIKRNADVTVSPAEGDWSNGWSMVNPNDARNRSTSATGCDRQRDHQCHTGRVPRQRPGRARLGRDLRVHLLAHQFRALPCHRSERPSLSQGGCMHAERAI